MTGVFGLITGSGFYDLPDLEERAAQTVATPYGPVELTTGRWWGQDVAFLPRHGAGHVVPPHAISYRANIWALADHGVDTVLATAVSGGITERMSPGTLVAISDVIDFTSGRADTFFDGTIDPGFGAGPVTHTDMVGLYDDRLRAAILAAGAAAGIPVVDGGVYCTTNGPRFETPAEITMMARLGGDLVGMTGYPEVALAREAGLRYASIGVVSNWAAGVGGAELSLPEIMDVIAGVADDLYRLVGGAIDQAAGAPT